ncbi:MAG: site-specific integrase [Leptospira sp.]|nr:site-specific integrase [Leptospira sp.]
MLNQFENLLAFPSPPIDLLIDLKTLSSPQFSSMEVHSLLQYFRKRNHKHYLIIKFLFSTGASIPELTHFPVKNLNFDNEYLIINERKRLGYRKIFLEKEFTRELYRFCADLNEGSLLFAGRKGQSRNVRSIQKILNTASQFLGKEITIPTIRDFLAVALFEQSVSLRDIQNFLGHRSQKSTKNRIFKPQISGKDRMGHNFNDFQNKAA